LDEAASLKLAEHYEFTKHSVSYINLPELGSLYYPGLFSYMGHMSCFRDVFDDKEAFQARIKQMVEAVILRFGYDVHKYDESVKSLQEELQISAVIEWI
jgi:hypothetical protein